MVECRFWFPRFSSLRTIIAVPAEIKYSDPEVATIKLKEATALLKKVKDVLEDEDQMKAFCRYHEDEIEKYVGHKDIVMKINDIIDEESTGVLIKWENVEESMRHAYSSYFGKVINDKEQINLKNLQDLNYFHFEQLEKIKLDTILEC